MHVKVLASSIRRCSLFLFLVSLSLNLLLVCWIRRSLKRLPPVYLQLEAPAETAENTETIRTRLETTIDGAICGRNQAVYFNSSMWLYVENWRSPGDSNYAFHLRIVSRGREEQLILAEWDTARPGRGDFLAIFIRSDRLVFVFDPGRGLTDLMHPSPLPHNTWIEVRAWRKKREAGLTVDGVSVSTELYGTAVGVNANSGLYIGGVPLGSKAPAVIPRDGFLGCVSKLTLNNNSLSLTRLRTSRK